MIDSFLTLPKEPPRMAFSVASRAIAGHVRQERIELGASCGAKLAAILQQRPPLICALGRVSVMPRMKAGHTSMLSDSISVGSP
jgi:hypothetical protein